MALTFASAPAQQYIEYEISDKHATGHNQPGKYWGPPTEEQDRAWDDLIARMFSHLTLPLFYI